MYQKAFLAIQAREMFAKLAPNVSYIPRRMIQISESVSRLPRVCHAHICHEKLHVAYVALRELEKKRVENPMGI